MSNCFICGYGDVKLLNRGGQFLLIPVSCPICGSYKISEQVVSAGLIKQKPELKYLLSATTRHASGLIHW